MSSQLESGATNRVNVQQVGIAIIAIRNLRVVIARYARQAGGFYTTHEFKTLLTLTGLWTPKRLYQPGHELRFAPARSLFV
jgi:hypothetical protein